MQQYESGTAATGIPETPGKWERPVMMPYIHALSFRQGDQASFVEEAL
jgi:hypothetical protein